MKYKKILTRLLMFSMAAVLAFSGCAKKPDNSNNSPTQPGTTVSTPKDKDTLMVQNNISEYKIVYPALSSTDSRIQRARDEIAYFFKESTDAVIPSVSDSNLQSGGKYISLGNTTLFQESGIDLSKVDYGTDGYKIKTIGDTVFICGPTLYGAMYGVYEFLYYTLGVKIYALDEMEIPTHNKVNLKDFDIDSVPSIETRALGLYYKQYDISYEYRLRLNPNNGRDWVTWAHTHFELLPKNVYLADHPDWYSADKAQLNLTNEEMRAEMVKAIKEKIMARNFSGVSTVYVMIGQEDTNVFCECDACLESNRLYGGPSGTMMRFINAIAREINPWVEENYPGKTAKLITFAYHKTVEPPVKETSKGYVPVHESVVAEKNVGVMLAPLGSNWHYNLKDTENNAKTAFGINGWTAIGAEMFIWTYSAIFDDLFLFIPNWSHLKDSYQAFKDSNALYIFDQSLGATNLPFYNLNNYVRANLLWDLNNDPEKLIDEFITAYYKDAAPYVKEYFYAARMRYNLLEQQYINDGKGFNLTSYVRTQPDYKTKTFWPKNWLLNGIKLFDKAIVEAEKIADLETREKIVLRVRTERLAPLYLLMELYRDELTNTEILDNIKEFEEVTDLVGIHKFSEHDNPTKQAKYNSWRSSLT